MKTICLYALVAFAQPAVAQTALTGQAAELYRKAQSAKFFADATKLNPQILPTADGRSFLAVWHAPSGTSAPRHWIVSLHGTQGFATDDLALWSRHLNGRDIGLLCVQWWLGRGNSPDA
jgi:poly(3-hydroxybutyrate) depolymerase